MGLWVSRAACMKSVDGILTCLATLYSNKGWVKERRENKRKWVCDKGEEKLAPEKGGEITKRLELDKVSVIADCNLDDNARASAIANRE
jgi:hypothetical protein